MTEKQGQRSVLSMYGSRVKYCDTHDKHLDGWADSLVKNYNNNRLKEKKSNKEKRKENVMYRVCCLMMYRK